MTDKRFIGYFAAGVLTAAALYGIYVWVHPRTGGDDEPIVVAGGSLEIGSRGFIMDASGKKAIHWGPKRFLDSVDVLYNMPGNGGPTYATEIPASGQAVTIKITYCLAPPTGGTCPDLNKSDTITLITDTTHNHLEVSNQNEAFDRPNPPRPKRLRHGQALWRVTNINVDGTDYKCDNGKCQLVLHYRCSTIPNPGVPCP